RLSNGKAKGRKPGAASHIRWLDPETLQESGGTYHFDHSAWSGDSKTTMTREGGAVSKDLEKLLVLLRLIGHHDDTHNARDAVGVFLKGRVPKILRIVLLARREMDIAGSLVLGKGKREPDLHCRAIRPLCFALETKVFRGSNTGRGECRRVGACIFRFEYEQREALAAGNEVPVVCREHRREGIGAEPLRFGQRQQLDEKPGQLYDMVVCPPRVAIARAHGKAESAIK